MCASIGRDTYMRPGDYGFMTVETTTLTASSKPASMPARISSNRESASLDILAASAFAFSRASPMIPSASAFAFSPTFSYRASASFWAPHGQLALHVSHLGVQ